MTLVDRFDREVTYLRISVTDRCDFRCTYCMAEEMTFLPRDAVLSLEELYDVASAFVALGVRKIRITGGEPLIRRNLMALLARLNRLEGLDELVLTTNGARLDRFARPLKEAGVRRINISLDSLDAQRFKTLTRTGNLFDVIRGIDAARDVGFERLKINSVILRDLNDDEVCDLVQFALDRAMDIAFIEEMPLGVIEAHSRADAFVSSDEILMRLRQRFNLVSVSEASETDGPSVYHRVKGRSTRIGFISPHSHNFCHLCNRVRLTAEGRLLLCLGNEHSVDLRAVMRSQAYLDAKGVLDAEGLALQQSLLQQAIKASMSIKPERHYFTHDDEPQLLRFMNMTGG